MYTGEITLNILVQVLERAMYRSYRLRTVEEQMETE